MSDHSSSPPAAPDPLSTAPVDVELMLQQLYDWDPSLRMRAARAFCDLEEPRAVSKLVDLLTDPCLLVRVSAAYGLGRNSGSGTVEALIQSLKTEWNGYVRKGVVWALGNSRDGRALPILVDALQTDIGAVRLWAASALGQLLLALGQDVEWKFVVTPLLQGLLRDPIAVVRSNCAWTLGTLATTHAVGLGSQYPEILQGLIQSLAGDSDLGVQDDVRSALEKIADPVGLEAIADLELDA